MFRDLYYRNITINGPEQKQDEFDEVLGALSEYSPIDQKYIEAKNKLLHKAKDFSRGEKKLLKGLKTKYFKFFMKMKIADLSTMMRMILEIIMVSSITKSLNRLINLKRRSVNHNLSREYFKYQDPDSMLEDMYSTRKIERNNIQVALIRSALTNFTDKINSMSENEIRLEQPNKIVNIVEKILEFNRQQSGQGLKTLTLNQILNRLPIFLAQLKAGKKSEKLKNRIRQLLHSLYRSKKLTNRQT